MKLLFRFLRPHRKLVALILVVMLIDNTGTLLVPTMLANMVNEGIVSSDVSHIVSGGFEMLVATLMASGGAVLGCYLAAKLAARVGRDIRNAIYDKSLQFSSGDFERFGTGSMITRSLGDINVIQQSIIMTIQMVLPVPFLCVVGTVLAFRIDYQMGLLLLAVVVVMLIIAAVTMRHAAPIFMKLQGFIDRMNVVLRENIIGVRVIRAFNKEHAEERRMDKVFSEYAENAIHVNWLFAGLDCSCFFIMNIVEVMMLWLGGNRVGVHAMEIASISAVIEYVMLILFFIMMAQMAALSLPRAFACLERAAEVIDLDPEIADAVDAADEATLSRGAAVLTFDHASFRFSDADEDTLHDIDFACRRGQTTAIIGSTGSGKSTITKLLLRFHDVTGGRVLFDGCDIREMRQGALRDGIAYVPQKAWLFSGTIRDNLRYGKSDATDDEMRHALEIAQSEFVFDLPEGLDAPVAQGGTNFSGGQRQRLAIARALMKRADLYVFDDSFSALDFKTDAALRHALASEMKDAATLIVAQRISTILHTDQIIVLKDGCVVGRGRHEELMETCEVYRDIAESQMKGGDRRDG